MKDVEREANHYFFAYYILLTALKTSDINEGISKSLYFIKMHFDADDIILYELDENGEYVHKFNQPYMHHNSKITTEILNTAKHIVENRKYYEMKLNFDDLHNIIYVPIIFDKSKYVIAITSNNQCINIDESLMTLLSESMYIVLDKYDYVNKLKKDVEIDPLTGLDNRYSYEKVIKEKELSNGMVYVLFDLFRLKSINDNYSHALGDEYIKQTAEVLKRYFPKYIYTKDINGKTQKLKTGSCVYRIGGDEFVLLSENESFENIEIKIILAQEEVKNLKLNISDPIGINYGAVVRNNQQTIKDLYLEADHLLAIHKNETYKVLGLNRRR